MSEEVVRCTDSLVKALLNSEEYRNYQECERQLLQQPELWAQVNDFRIKNYHLQKQEGIDLFEEVDRLEKEYRDLRRNTLANAYLESELSVCRMLQTVQSAITERVHVTVPEEV